MARSPQWRIYYHRMWGKLSTTCSNVLKQPNGELLVAVNHNLLWTMASETVDPIDWSHPPPSFAVPPARLVHSINQCNLSGIQTCNRSMRGNRLAYAATQGMFQQGYIVALLQYKATRQKVPCLPSFILRLCLWSACGCAVVLMLRGVGWFTSM